jgi:hypothetical protein
MDTFEVPYGGKAWAAFGGFLFMCFCMAIMALAAIKDPDASFKIRIIILVMFAWGSFPLYVCGASFVVIQFVKRTLKLTTTEISAPRFGFSLHSTHVSLSTVTRVSLSTFRNGRRYLDIYYKGGRLGIAEALMPSPKEFNRVLRAFSGTPGANNSFNADGTVPTL